MKITRLSTKLAVVSAICTMALVSHGQIISTNIVPDRGPGASGAMTMPGNLSDFWLAGKLSATDPSAKMTVTNNGVTVGALTVTGESFVGKVPLVLGDNKLEVTYSNDKGVTITRPYTVIRSDRYRADITSPTPGKFANGQPQSVFGFVSALLDEGTTGAATIKSVAINGVPATLTSPDGSGNRGLYAPGVAPPDCDHFLILTAEIAWENGAIFKIPLGLLEGYLITEMQREYHFEFLHFQEFTPLWFVSTSSHRLDLYYNFTCQPPALPLQPNSFADAYRWIPDTDFVGAPGLGTVGWLPDIYLYEEKYLPQPPLKEGFIWGGSLDYGFRFGTEDGHNCSFSDCSRQGFYKWTFDASLMFRAPASYGPNTPVIFTFEGIEYGKRSIDDLDLSLVKYNGKDPVTWDNARKTASYLVTLDGGASYSLGAGSFSWPAITDSIPITHGAVHYDWLHFEGFHNAEPKISDGGVDVTGKTTTTIVGAKHNFSVVIPEIRPEQIDSYKWTITDKTVRSYTITADKGEFVLQTDSPPPSDPKPYLERSELPAYWIDAGEKAVSCVVTIKDPNGNLKPLEPVRAKFDVKRPTVTRCDGIGTALDPPVNVRGGNLQFGEGDVSKPQNFGILVTAQTPDFDLGDFTFVQLVKPQRIRTKDDGTQQVLTSQNYTSPQGEKFTAFVADDAAGVPISFVAKKDVRVKGQTVKQYQFPDVPSTSLDGIKKSAKDAFEVYFMFEPKDKNGNSLGISVPVAKMVWNWGGSATLGASGWTLDKKANGTTPNSDPGDPGHPFPTTSLTYSTPLPTWIGKVSLITYR